MAVVMAISPTTTSQEIRPMKLKVSAMVRIMIPATTLAQFPKTPRMRVAIKLAEEATVEAVATNPEAIAITTMVDTTVKVMKVVTEVVDITTTNMSKLQLKKITIVMKKRKIQLLRLVMTTKIP